MIKRWYLTLAGLVVAIGLVGGAVVAVPVSYQAKADVVLIPAANSSTNADNPLLGLTGLQSVADVLARTMADPVEVQKLKQQGVTGKYTVARDLTTDGPILVVTVDGDGSAAVLRELKMIVDDMAPSLAQVQQSASIPKNAQIGLLTLSIDDRPTPVRKSQLRAVIVAVVASLLIIVLIVNLGDRLLRRRGRRENETSDVAVASDDVITTGDEVITVSDQARVSDESVVPVAEDERDAAELISSALVMTSPEPELAASSADAEPEPVGTVANDESELTAGESQLAEPERAEPELAEPEQAEPEQAEPEQAEPEPSVAAIGERPRRPRRPNPLPPGDHVSEPVRYRPTTIDSTSSNGHLNGHQRGPEAGDVDTAEPTPTTESHSNRVRKDSRDSSRTGPASPNGSGARSRIRRVSRPRRQS